MKLHLEEVRMKYYVGIVVNSDGSHDASVVNDLGKLVLTLESIDDIDGTVDNIEKFCIKDDTKDSVDKVFIYMSPTSEFYAGQAFGLMMSRFGTVPMNLSIDMKWLFDIYEMTTKSDALSTEQKPGKLLKYIRDLNEELFHGDGVDTGYKLSPILAAHAFAKAKGL